MKIICSLFALLFAAAVSAQNSKQVFSNPNTIVDTFKKSIACKTTRQIEASSITINYYSPGVKNRIIWGGLVPYNQVWVTGAHAATNISFSKHVVIGQTAIAPGTYAIFTIPGKDEWIFILNKNYQQHLTDDYKQEEDLLRLVVKPLINNPPLERLQYFIEENKLVIAWEQIRIEVPVKVLH
jgi:hypothetical protein